MRSLSMSDGLNANALRDAIGASTPVLEFRPVRGPLLRTTNDPNEDSFTVSPRSFQNSAGTNAMLQIDPWVKAAECDGAIGVAADPERRSALISLKSLWVALGDEQSIFERSRQAGRVPKIAQILAELMSLYKHSMNQPGFALGPGKAESFAGILLYT